MKKLYIIRHAKSSWKNSSLSDFDRPLNKRGITDAPLMGKVLKGKKVSPDAIISSPALRAKTTAQIISKKLNFNKHIIYDENIYEANVDTLMNVVKRANKEDSIVFIFGHNPGLNMLAESLVGLHENIPTCGVVELEFACKKWSEISPENAKLISFDYPKKYK
ncbi:SixA phosphatase family protein [Candidatus Sulfurimonas baltica]|uniref:Histidine phosphatase family protein n=1 Tax=Candidatus Sulfurimonas baltica TaxID=2740404 RepID=A0A7S7LUG5_9BACT|nr:histidine phosphatase family protein [Candidatus Sulfurimonas baltica]QOY51714.1 histidine phosphatase family protein [Candidatus Sulfurimonas baltica]